MYALMRTEMARVQTEAQMQSLKQNGFDEYQFLALGNACEICRAIDGKHFPVDKMMPGLNAPPMHPNCRCSTSAYMDRGEFDQWLDAKSNNGIDNEKVKKTTINYAKKVDEFIYDKDDVYGKITPEAVLEELKTTTIGRETLDYIHESGIKPKFEYEKQMHFNRGQQMGDLITIFVSNNDSVKITAQTIIHEITHHKYNIGECLWAEAVCFAKEKMHSDNKTHLTWAEKRSIVKLVKENYNLAWKRGGYKNGKYL